MNSITYADFDYRAHFGSEEIAIQAQSALTNFKGLLQKSFKGLVDCGKELQQSRDDCLADLGEKEGQRKFNEWLASTEFGGSRYLAEVSIQLAQWYEKLPRNLRRLVTTKCESWNLSWLQVLCRKASGELEKFLNQVEQLKQRDGKITAARLKAIATSKKCLTLGQPASDEDWDLITLKYGLDSEQLNALKDEAQRHAEINPYTGEREVTTDSVVEALNSFNLNPTLVLPKQKVKRYSQNEVEQMRQEIEVQMQQKYEAQLADKLEEVRAQTVAESEARSQQHLAKMQQALSVKDKQIETVAAQKVKLEQEKALLRQQLAQFQSEQPVVPTSQRNEAKSAKISGADSVSLLNDTESSERSPLGIGESPRANPLEIAQTLSEVKKPSSLANLVGNNYTRIPPNAPLKSFRAEHPINQRKSQSSSSTRGRGFGHR